MLYNKKDLFDIIVKNRTTHRGFFDEAQKAYRAAVIEQLDKHLQNAKKGKRIQSYIQFIEPVEHTSDYDRILKMLEMTTQDTVELEEKMFAWYVLDDWQWKQQYLSTNSTYTTAEITEKYYRNK